MTSSLRSTASRPAWVFRPRPYPERVEQIEGFIPAHKLLDCHYERLILARGICFSCGFQQKPDAPSNPVLVGRGFSSDQPVTPNAKQTRWMPQGSHPLHKLLHCHYERGILVRAASRSCAIPR